MDRVKLDIILNNRVISIPFTDIKALDAFTSTYDDKLSLTKALNNIFMLDIELFDVVNCYVSYNLGNDRYTNYCPVKYSTDRFKMSSVRELYTAYAEKDFETFKENTKDIKIVIRNYLNKTNKANLTNEDIRIIISLYLGDTYRRYRDAYFILKENNYKVKKEQPINDIDQRRTKLTNYSSADSFISHLIEYSKVNPDTALETLASYDLEEIKQLLKNKDLTIIDGLGDKENIPDTYGESQYIEQLTGKSIKEMMDSVNIYPNNGTRKR